VKHETYSAKKVPAQKSDIDLVKLITKFDTDEKCRIALEKLRWPDGILCIRCGSDKISRNYKRNQFECTPCGYHFSVTAGTIFHDSHLPLRKWFIAIYLLSESKKGMSALQLKRTLGVAYKTAWYLCHRIREAVKDADTTLLGLDSGFVECDEAFIGGKAKWMHEADRAKRREGGNGRFGKHGKKVVFGAIERGGNVRLQSGGLHSVKKELLREFLKAKLADETKVISTDEHGGYIGIGDDNTIHVAVTHKNGEYVRGLAHTNTLENVWSLFKRSIVGSYHQISIKHIDRYLDEFEFRFNNRHNPFLFRDTLLRLLSASNLEYDQLTGKKAA
jgi:transposase-like protein